MDAMDATLCSTQPSSSEHMTSAQQTCTNDVVPASLLSILPFILPLCQIAELETLGLVDHESEMLCETEWKLRVISRFGSLRFSTCSWRKVFQLRCYFQRKVVNNVSSRVYFMNTRGETTCFTMDKGKSMMCSRERAIVYNRCERMFDLSLRINRSIQEISALIGMVSVDEARGLLNEHINLMASVSSLRSSLMFESELFQVFPAPVLLDANTLLRGTFQFPEEGFLDTTTVMMQMWASIDGLIYRPLAPPSIIEAQDQPVGEEAIVLQDEEQQQPADALTVGAEDRPGTTAVAEPPVNNYKVFKLHELSGMTIHIDDNTLRYRLQEREMCVNALVSNSYLLYLFNPQQFRPMDWTYEAVLYVGDARWPLPTQREGVFLNSNSLAMRAFLSYGKMPERPARGSGSEEQEHGGGPPARTGEEEGTRGSENSDPLAIPYDGEAEVFSFILLATNRITRETKEIVNKATCFSLQQPQAQQTTSSAQVSPMESSVVADKTMDILEKPRNQRVTASAEERHVHLPYDAMICYCFSEDCSLQYVEFAIGYEALMHRLEVTSFLSDARTSTK